MKRKAIGGPAHPGPGEVAEAYPRTSVPVTEGALMEFLSKTAFAQAAEEPVVVERARPRVEEELQQEHDLPALAELVPGHGRSPWREARDKVGMRE